MGLRLVRLPLVAAALVAAATATATAASSTGRPVNVTLREYAIVLPVHLRPGPTTFVLHNRGRFPHNFTALYGPVHFHSRTVAPGATARLTVRLVPGEYLVACTVLNGGHLAEGMLAQFTIGSRAHGSGSWHYP